MEAEVKQGLMAHLKYWCKGEPSESGLRVALLLESWQGLHHMDTDQMKKVDWTNQRYQVINLSKFFTPGGGLASADFNDLTTLVFLCHDHCIRVQIHPCNHQFLELSFHPRNSRDGGMSQRHPTIEMAVAQWREKHANIFVQAQVESETGTVRS